MPVILVGAEASPWPGCDTCFLVHSEEANLRLVVTPVLLVGAEANHAPGAAAVPHHAGHRRGSPPGALAPVPEERYQETRVPRSREKGKKDEKDKIEVREEGSRSRCKPLRDGLSVFRV